MKLRRLIFPLGVALGLFLIVAIPSLAQHSQPEKVGLFMTPVIHRNQPLTRTRTLYLPQLAAAAITTKPSGSGGGHSGGNGGNGGNKGGGSTACPSGGGSTYNVGCPVAPTTTVPEAEEEIAADPADANGLTYVAAISDFSLRGGYNTTKWAITTTGGGSSSDWAQHFVDLNSQKDPVTSDGLVWGANSDPDVAIEGSSGSGSSNVFLSDLYISSGTVGNNVVPNGLYVSYDTISNLSNSGSTAGYFTNTEPVMVNTGTTQACAPAGPNPLKDDGFCFEDKPWVAVDQSNGYVYVVWAHWWSCYYLGFGAIACDAGPDIYLAYSTNHGQSWNVWSQNEVVNSETVAVPIPIDQGNIPTTSTSPTALPQSGHVQGPQVAVGPNGTVYIAYEAFDPTSNTRWQYLTWSPAPTASAPGAPGPLSFNFSTPTNVTPTKGFQDLSFNPNYRVNSFPALAVGPGSQGQVYLEYADQVSTNSQIEFVACTGTVGNTTANCSTPKPTNSSTKGQQFFPAIAVAPTSGLINTSWFDTRFSSKGNVDFDVFAAFNSGSGFSPSARVTPTSINTGSTNFIGDYSGIAAVYYDGTNTKLNMAHPVWNDFSETCGRIVCTVSGTMQTSTLTTTQ